MAFCMNLRTQIWEMQEVQSVSLVPCQSSVLTWSTRTVSANTAFRGHLHEEVYHYTLIMTKYLRKNILNSDHYRPLFFSPTFPPKYPWNLLDLEITRALIMLLLFLQRWALNFLFFFLNRELTLPLNNWPSTDVLPRKSTQNGRS